MSFLTPLFFAGLAGIAVPVIIHLIQKERKNVVAFPSLMFLRQDPVPVGGTAADPQLAAAAARLAALALIVMAFARPFLRSEAIAAACGRGAREVVILLDRSYSIGYGDRWQRAVAAARHTVNALGASRPRQRGAVRYRRGSRAAIDLRQRDG